MKTSWWTKNLENTLKVIPMGTVIAFVAVLLITAVQAHRENQAFREFQAHVALVSVVPPQSSPVLSQESIDAAMELFSIQKPVHTAWPVLDEALEERGLTTGALVTKRKTVSIGAPAFVSWSILGSTLAHELEVHANQSFLKIMFVNSAETFRFHAKKFAGNFVRSMKPSAAEVFERGTWSAERQAYEYEIKSAARFHLTAKELRSIRYVMNLYYPVRTKVGSAANSLVGVDQKFSSVSE